MRTLVFPECSGLSGWTTGTFSPPRQQTRKGTPFEGVTVPEEIGSRETGCMESGQLLRSMMGGETGLQLQLPPMATATEHASDHFSTQIQAANLLQFGQHMTDSRSHSKRNTDRPQSNIFHNGRAQAEGAIKKQRTSSSLAVNPHSISIPSPVVNVGVVNTALNGVYHPALPTIQGLVNLSSSTPQVLPLLFHVQLGLLSPRTLLPGPGGNNIQF